MIDCQGWLSMAMSGRRVNPYRRGKENHGGSTIPVPTPNFSERHFWLLACGVVLISVVTRVFDFSIAPPEYNGLVITEPFCGLHSWDLAERAWAARSHVKYGLGYTKGLRTLVVGDPPPEHPEYYVSHPPLETWIWAAGMLVLGTEDWSVRLFDVLFGVPCLFVIVQVNWAGVFYAFVIGVHYVVHCLMRRQVRWKLMTALALPSLLSLGMSFSMMA